MRLKLVTISISVILASICIANIAQAQAVPFFGEAENICELIKNIFYFGVSLAGVAAVVVITIGGIIYMVSFGSEEKKKTAMDLMGGALKGLLLALFSWTIFYIINPYVLRCKVPVLPVELPDLCEDVPEDQLYDKPEDCETACKNIGFCYKKSKVEKWCCVTAIIPSCAGAAKTFSKDEKEKCEGECGGENTCWFDADMEKWCCISVAPPMAVDPCWGVDAPYGDENMCKSVCLPPKHCQQTKEGSAPFPWCCTHNNCKAIDDKYQKIECLRDKIKIATGCDTLYQGLGYASDPLLNLIDCIADRLYVYKAAGQVKQQDIRISSIMDCKPGTPGDPRPSNQNCTAQNHGCPCCTPPPWGQKCGECVHKCGSCHYGGKTCNLSYAVDWGRPGAEVHGEIIKEVAKLCGADYTLDEGDHIHISVGYSYGCNCY